MPRGRAAAAPGRAPRSRPAHLPLGRALLTGALLAGALAGAPAGPAPAGTEPSPDGATLALGRQVFVELAQPQCAICHTFADAGATGEIGPDLDRHEPAREPSRVRAAVEQGVGSMPPFVDVLTPEQIEAVALYVATRGGKEAAEGQ